MDRIKELAIKLQAGSITEAEQAELKSLLEKSESKDLEIEISAALKKELAGVVSEEIAKKLEAIEGVRKTKEVGETDADPEEDEGDDETDENKKPVADVEVSDKMAGKRLFAKQLVALTKGNQKELRKLNAKAIASQIKAGYMNTADAAEGGDLVPPAEFLADVQRLDGVYGVALRDANVRNISGNSLQVIRKATGLRLVETAQAAKKPATKMTFATDTVTLRKFTGIAPYTEELDEDAAISLYDELVKDFALARNLKADELVFTDPTTGLLNVAGTAAVTFGANITSATFEAFSTAINKIPRSARVGAKWYISDALEAVLRNAKVESNFAWGPAADSNPGKIWGYGYEVVEALPVDQATDQGYAVFGNLKNVTLIVKKGLELKLLTEATITDTEDVEINLAEQDMVALRAVTRMNALVSFPQKFVQLGTGSVS